MPLLIPKTRTPHPFQTVGMRFLVDKGRGFLWDAPGLGKTYQAIVAAYNLSSEDDRPILVVCPNAVKLWWAKEISAVYPSEKKRIARSVSGGRFRHWSGRQHLVKSELLPDVYRKKNPRVRWYITHYEGLRILKASYGKIRWGTVILDESHYVKNRKAQRTKAVLEVTPPLAYRIGLTATPFGKNPADLWSQLFWMAPEIPILKSYWRFFSHFVDYDNERAPAGHRYKRVKGGKNLEQLAVLMSACGLQRSKAEVAKQLPPIQFTDMPISLEGRQDLIYTALKDKNRVELVIKSTADDAADGDVKGLVVTNVLSRLARMEQWLSCPWEFDPGVKGGKMGWLMNWAQSYPEAAVIVSRFKSTARTIAKELNAKLAGRAGAGTGTGTGPACRPITGDISQKLRDVIIDQWRDGQFQFLSGTIHTMGTGLNLQRAHSMVCFDQLYDSILMEQVIHRIHRLDSDHPVGVIYLYFPRTSNEVVLQAFRHKWEQRELVRRFLLWLRTGEDKPNEG
jgi:SNF2 family DNA or RNA helicase